MVEFIIIEYIDGYYVVCEMHFFGGDGGNGRAIGENNIYRGVWGRGEKRRRNIKGTIKVVTGSAVEPYVGRGGR